MFSRHISGPQPAFACLRVGERFLAAGGLHRGWRPCLLARSSEVLFGFEFGRCRFRLRMLTHTYLHHAYPHPPLTHIDLTRLAWHSCPTCLPLRRFRTASAQSSRTAVPVLDPSWRATADTKSRVKDAKATCFLCSSVRSALGAAAERAGKSRPCHHCEGELSRPLAFWSTSTAIQEHCVLF